MFFTTIPFLFACTASTPKSTSDICEIFREKDDWYDDAKESSNKWGVPIHVTMAIMHQESHFVADAKTPRTYLLGFIPWSRVSTAYGYAQALDGTWDHYLESTDTWGEDRDDFADASSFIGWYCLTSYKKLGISKWDAKNQYLAYHEGMGGFKRKTYLKKPWLDKIARKVGKKASLFHTQLSQCKEELEATGWWFFW